MITSNHSHNGSRYSPQHSDPAAMPSNLMEKVPSATPGCSLPREASWQGAPFADDKTGTRIEEYREDMATIGAQSPGLVGFGCHLLRDSHTATQTLHRSTEEAQDALQRQRNNAMTARDNFPQTVEAIYAAERAATSSIQAQLNRTGNELARIQAQLTTTASDADSGFSFDAEKPEEALRVLPALKRKENKSKKNSERRENQETAPEYDNPDFVWFTDSAMGIALGLFIAVELNVLTMDQIKEMDLAHTVPLVLYAVLGVGMIVSLKAGFFRLWKWAAAQWVSKDWSATIIASLITAFIFAVDVSIVRAFRLSDPTILNPNDLGYWLSSCVFVLPCAFAAATKGWMYGIKPSPVPEPSPLATENNPDAAQDAMSTASPVVNPVHTQPVLPEQNLSPDAFKAMVTYAKALMEEHARLSEERDRIVAPFQTLLKLREEELVFATEPDEFTRQRLETDRSDAVMNHEYAKAFILRVILAFERTTHIDVNNFIKVDAKSVVVKNTSQKKPGLWARLRDRWTNFRKRRQTAQGK